MAKSVSVVIPVLCCQSYAMHSDIPLVQHCVCGRSMLGYVVETAGHITDMPVVITAGKCSESIREQLNGIGTVLELPDEQSSAFTYLHSAAGLCSDSEYLILFPGNLPLVTVSTLRDMVEFTDSRRLDAVALTGNQSMPPDSSNIVFCFRVKWLSVVLTKYRDKLEAIPMHALNLWNLPVAEAAAKEIFQPPDPQEAIAVIDRITLAEAESRMRLRINYEHMRNGVTLIDPAQTYIGPDVRIGQDTVIYPGNVLEGSTFIGRGCTLYPNNRLHNAWVGERVSMQSSVILESSIGDETTVGPYAYIRPGSEIGRQVRIGDFVEIKKSVIGHGTKISHLTYIGDAQLGEAINVGCGVVCVNYDGRRKQKVIIGDHAFIGCNVNLVAPVEVEHHSYIAAGSTITERVPAKALAIARARQINKEGWVDKRAEQEQKEQSKTEESK
ncbi:MAG: DapH/DapD/GlmU-related protein [Caldicoprobacterales bacterium]|jgi:bifunctional UDP-N-acetylglucosamine pyrophosphorylase/glucosamine-1-phosphate N-acetyltransferase